MVFINAASSLCKDVLMMYEAGGHESVSRLLMQQLRALGHAYAVDIDGVSVDRYQRPSDTVPTQLVDVQSQTAPAQSQ